MINNRPTPEQVVDGTWSLPPGAWKAVRALREAGMVVGYPDDPRVQKAVFGALAAEVEEDYEYDPVQAEAARLALARRLAKEYATDPQVARAVLAAMEDNCWPSTRFTSTSTP